MLKVKESDVRDILIESAEELDEVVLFENPFNKPIETPLSINTFSSVEIESYPGANNDITKVVQSMPGLSPSVGGFRNDLIIRGGAPNETVFYLDEIEIPNINHFSTQGSSGGPRGMINIAFIQDVTLSTSAFGAEYDNPLSGVLQFRQRTGNPNTLTVILDLGPVSQELALMVHFLKQLTIKPTLFFSKKKLLCNFYLNLLAFPFDQIIGIISGKLITE